MRTTSSNRANRLDAQHHRAGSPLVPVNGLAAGASASHRAARKRLAPTELIHILATLPSRAH